MQKRKEGKVKKQIITVMICVLCFALTACRKDVQGTYYPDHLEMQTNLEAAGYEVSVKNRFDEGDIGTYLFAVKGSDYIEFYWLDQGESVDKISNQLESQYGDYEKLVSLKGDSEFGSLVFCGTDSAIHDSGIVIVDVKVDTN